MIAVGGPFDGQDIGGDDFERTGPIRKVAHLKELKLDDFISRDEANHQDFEYSTYKLSQRSDGYFWEYVC